MLNFTFHNPVKIIFGRDVENNVGTETAQYSKRVLLHYGGGSIKKNGIYDKVTESLKQAGVFFVELGGVKPNPRLSLVRKGIELCRENQLDFILAVGGGSTIDSAKAIAVGVPYDGDVWDFFTGKAAPKSGLGIGSVLTIAAAGSESSSGAVITNEDGGLKRAYGCPQMVAKFAFLNPETTASLPAYQSACGAADILAHLMERYFTQVEHVDFTDRMLEASMRTVIYNTPQMIREPDNYDYRAEIMWCGTIAHNSLLDTGRIGDWGSHNIEHELSGMYDIAHGAGLAIVFPAWMRYVYRENISRFVQFAVRVFDVDLAFADRDAIVLEGIARLETFFQSIGLPIRLSQAGIGDDRLTELASKAFIGAEHLGNFKKLYEKDVLEILRLAAK